MSNFNQESLKDELFSVVNLHMPSGLGGASVVLLVLGLGLAGYTLAKWRQKRKNARRAVTSLELQKCPALLEGEGADGKYSERTAKTNL